MRRWESSRLRREGRGALALRRDQNLSRRRSLAIISALLLLRRAGWRVAEELSFMMSEHAATRAGLVDEERCIWSLLLPLRSGGRSAEPCTAALEAGRNTAILFMARLCSLAEPTGPAQTSRAYPYMVSPGRWAFQYPAHHSRGMPTARHMGRLDRSSQLIGMMSA